MIPDASERSDGELIDWALQGNQRGFEELTHRYQDRLFASIRRDVGCPILAEDIVQDAFVRAFTALASFRGGSAFYTWLYRIAMNSRRTYMRKCHATVALQHDWDGGSQLQKATPDSPSDRIERDETRVQVRQALSRLDENHRRILILREFDGHDYQTIAQVLRVNMGTVRSRLARARSRLKKELTPYVQPERYPKTVLAGRQESAKNSAVCL
jgi:RNA polymerase sigma-70 factor (ECF subfamily)